MRGKNVGDFWMRAPRRQLCTDLDPQGQNVLYYTYRVRFRVSTLCCPTIFRKSSLESRGKRCRVSKRYLGGLPILISARYMYVYVENFKGKFFTFASDSRDFSQLPPVHPLALSVDRPSMLYIFRKKNDAI